MLRLKSDSLLFVAILCLGATWASAQPSRPGERYVLRSLRQIHSAQSTYQATTGNGNFGSLTELYQAGFIDEALASGSKYGYVYAVSTATGPSRFFVTATPRVYRKTGVRSFYIDTAGDIRGGDKNGGLATSTDPVIDDCTSGSIDENERCTLADMRLLVGAQMTFAATVGKGNYGLFDQLHSAGLIRLDLADYSARGYNYEVQIIDQVPGQLPSSFKIWATPQTYRTTAIRSFFVNQTGVIRGGDKNGGLANENDPPIE